MTFGLFPGLTGDERTRAIRRQELETEVQNALGPIINIADIDDATLYGMRDDLRAEQNTVGAHLMDDEP